MDYLFSNRISSLKPSVIREIFKYAADPEVILFAGGNPASEAIPAETIAELTARVLKEQPISALQYSVSEGYPKLRQTLRKTLHARYGIGNEQDELIIVSGAQQAIDLSCKALCNEGDTIICEAPSFIGSLNTFRSYNANLVGVPMESDGISIDKLELALKENKNIRFMYLIPNFQNPTGITMSLEKRKAAYALAKKYSVPILEDDPYAELRIAGEFVPPIKALDKDGLVIYAGTFSKTIAPGIRVGYVMAPSAVMPKLIVGKQATDVHTNIPMQMVCDLFMTETDLDAHYKRLRGIYEHKCGLMLSEIEKNFPAGIKFTRPQGGLFIWCTLPDSIDMLSFCKNAVTEHKVATVPGNAFMVREDEATNSFRMNFSTPSDERIIRGIEILGKILNNLS